MPHNLRPPRLAALLAIAGIAVGGALAMPGTARADGDTWRDGGCSEGEGQTLVIDWEDPGGPSGQSQSIIRCIFLEEGAEGYPVDPDNKLGAPLASAGLDFDPRVGMVETIEGVTAAEGEQYWFYVLGEIGNWTEDWEPQAEVDTFLGVSLSPLGEPRNPVPIPAFEMTAPPVEPTETLSPSPTPSATNTAIGPGDGGTSSTPTQTKTPSASPTRTTSPSETASATQPPTQESTTAPPATNSTTPSATASSTPPPQQATRPPRRTSRPPQRPNYQPQRPGFSPQQPFYPPLPPVDDEFPPPPTDDFDVPPPVDDDGQVTAAAEPSPSRVWGREDVVREDTATGGADGPAPWSQLAALAGAAVVVGGLGTAFARGLQVAQPPVVEDE